MYELARPAIYSYSIQRGTPHVNLRQKRASLFNSQILVVALIGIFGGLKPKMCVHFSKDWRSDPEFFCCPPPSPFSTTVRTSWRRESRPVLHAESACHLRLSIRPLVVALLEKA